MPDDVNGLREPLTVLEQSAAAQHEIFAAYVKAGFTQEQALEFMKTIIVSTMTAGGFMNPQS